MQIFHVLWKGIKGIFDFINTYFKVVVLLLIVLFLATLDSLSVGQDSKIPLKLLTIHII